MTMNNMINGYLIEVGFPRREETKGYWVNFTHKFYDPDQVMDVRIDVFDDTLICEIKGLSAQVREYFEKQLLGESQNNLASRQQSDQKKAIEVFALITQNIKLLGINPSNVVWQVLYEHE